MDISSSNLLFKFSSFLIVGLFLTISGCGDSTPPPPTKETLQRLATDVHVRIGGQPLRLPFVALRDYAYRKVSFSLDRAKDASRAHDASSILLASDSVNPLVLSNLLIEVREYGTTNEDLRYEAMCPLFTREWERSVCINSWSAILLALPFNDFLVVDLSQTLSSQDGVGLKCVNGTKITPDLLPKQKGAVTVLCRHISLNQNGPALYQAVIRIEGDLGVLWSIWDDKRAGESFDHEVRREGKALAAFFEFALGAEENFSQLYADMCELRGPRFYEHVYYEDCPR